MSGDEDKDSKTEDATEKKINEALEKGNTPFSKEAATFASLLVLSALAAFAGERHLTTMVPALAAYLEDPAGFPLQTPGDATAIFWGVALAVALTLLPIIGLLAIAGMGSSLAQNAPQLILDRIAPDLSRISPTKGFQRIFGPQGMAEFLKACFKLIVIGGVGVLLLQSAARDLGNAVFQDPHGAPELIRQLTAHSLFIFLLLTVCLVVVDVLWTRVFWRSELRMSRQEIKDETKQSEGDPLLKMRMRSIARDRIRKRMMAAVPTATLVIANPTHYAVALRYKHGETRAPLVVAKGQNLIALKIREIAEANGVSVIEDKRLARSLHDSVQVDALIPPEFFKAVAEIIIFLQSKRGGAYAKSMAMPPKPSW